MVINWEKKISLLSFDCSRKYIISRKQAEVPLSVPFDPRNQVGRPLVVKDAPAAEFRLTWFHRSLPVYSHCHHKYMLCLSLQVYLSYNNVSALKVLATKKNWRLTSEKDKVLLPANIFSSEDSTGDRVQRSWFCRLLLNVLHASPLPGSTLHPWAEVHVELQGGSRGGCSCWKSFPPAGWAQQQAKMGHALPVMLSQSLSQNICINI